MAFSTSQTPLSSASDSTWDVFLSFRGEDTRLNFTSHLYSALDSHGIRTFKDDNPELTGETISGSLIQAIQGSKTYVVVLSENYASSRWCLDELVEIYDCHKMKQRLVIPVFYNIDSAVVQHQSGSFKKAFKKFETRAKSAWFRKAFKKQQGAVSMDDVNKWRHTLTKVASFPGETVSAQRSEYDIINQVVDRLLLELKPMTLDVAKYPVGLDSRVEDITALMSNDTEGVIRIGIYGMGGVGKTTLAKAVYNHNYHRFQGSCFLANVREASVTKRGLVCLQQQLINDVLKCKNINIDNADQGIELIRARIYLIKVLIVIDDLDDPRPLEFLEGQFALGSTILITTRNEDLLDSINVEGRYKVNELGDAESRQLLTQHAFGDNIISDTFTKFSQEILDSAGGLPLALEVFGSKLLNQAEEELICIDKLKRTSIDDVEKNLLISFNALKLVDPKLQEIFLDIACFFMGRKKKDVVKIMETCYTFINRKIDILQKRCMLTINNRDELDMHDMIRDMGREIARNNSPEEPGKHSRLWVLKDICDVLKEHKGTEVIEGITHYIEFDPFKKVSYATETFRRMSKLRFLHLVDVNLTGSFERTLEDLRWLHWDWCPLKCLPSDFYPQKLVILELPHSKMRKLWDLNKVSYVFQNLKTLNMSYSVDLTTTPDFTKLPCLETLNLKGCESLKEVHISIGSLVRLLSLNLRSCVNLRSLQDNICNLRALKSLNIGGCSRLESLPIELGNIKTLKELKANKLTVSELPKSIGSLSKLVELRLYNNKNLRTLPFTICKLRALEVLDINNCSRLEALPLEFGKIESLKELHAKGLAVSILPDSIGSLSKLVELRLSNNKNLETLPDTMCNLRALEVLDIHNCSSLEVLPIELGDIESLKELHAEDLAISILPNSIGRLSKLVELRLSSNRKLETLPDTICNLRALKRLNIGYCNSLEALPIELGNIESLIKLEVWIPNVSKLPESIGRLSKLVELRLSFNKKLETLPDTICNLRSLEVLYLSGCENLHILPDQLWKMTTLRELYARGATLLKKLPDIKSCQIALPLKKLDLSWSGLTVLPSGIRHLSNLEYFNLAYCGHLLSIAELPPNLKQLDAQGCKSMERLPDLSDLKQLEYLHIRDCSGLTEIQGLKELSSIRRLHLEGCDSSLLKYTLTKGFFQVYSEFRHQIELLVQEFPDWISQSSDLGSMECCLDFSSHNFLAMILCFKHWDNAIGLDYSVKNTTSDFKWRGKFYSFNSDRESLMVIVPRSIVSVIDGDNRIELEADARIFGIHLLYKTELQMIDDDDNTTINKMKEANFINN